MTRTIDLTEALPDACRKHPSEFKTRDGEKLDRAQSIGASELWTCMRRTVFERQGQEREMPEGLGYFERGHAVEGRIMERLHQAIAPTGLELRYAFHRQISLQDPESRMHATPDGLLILSPVIIDGEVHRPVCIHGVELSGKRAANVEIKSLDPRSNMSVVKDAHRAQCQLQMALWSLGEWDCDHTLLLYVDASDYMRITVHVVERDSHFLQEARIRVGKIWDWIENRKPIDVPAEGRWTGECGYCPYQAACGEAILAYQPEEFTELDEDAAEEIEHELTVRRLSAKIIVDETMRKKAAEEAIKAVLAASNTNRAEVDGTKIVWSKVAGRRTIDQQALGDAMFLAHLDLEDDEYWKTGKAAERLVIT